MNKVIIAADILEGLFQLVLNAVHKQHSPNDIVNYVNTVKSKLEKLPEPTKIEVEKK